MRKPAGQGSAGHQGGRAASAGGRGSARTPQSEPTALGEALGAIRDRPGWAARLEGARIHERWAEIAGDQLACHVEPVRLAGGVLVVRASSSPWAEQVRYLAGDLARQANAVLGPGSVRQVTVVTGTLLTRS